MPSAPTTILASDTIYPGEGRWGGRAFDYMQNGYLWAVGREGTDARFYYSTDNGATWQESTASKITGVLSLGPVFFIDKDDYAHLLYREPSAAAWRYRRGTPNGSFTAFTWSSTLNLATYGFGDSAAGLDIVAHREGTGWKAHAFTCQADGSGIWILYHRINITSGGTLSLDITEQIDQFGSPVTVGLACDFRHEEADSKAVQSSTPSVYVAYYDVSGTVDNNLNFCKIAYSAGSWTVGPVRSLDGANAQAPQGVLGLVYDGTRIMVCSARSATDTVPRVFERNEADTTTTARTPTALSDGQVNGMTIGVGRNGDVWLLAQAATSEDWKKLRFNRGSTTWDGSWTVVEADASGFPAYPSMMRGMSSVGLGAVYHLQSTTPDQTHFVYLLENAAIEANLQGVASVTTADMNVRVGFDAALQGVATMTPDMQLRATAEVLMQGVARFTGEVEGVPFHDFTVYDCYLESSIRSEGLLFFDEQKPETVSRKLTPTRQDVGNNPEEVRPEFGDMFAQGDFSHGAGQRYFHQAGRNPKKFWYSEGFDISEPGKLTHLRTIAEARDSTTIGRIEQVGDVPVVINGQRVDVGNGSFPGSWTAEDPSGADADQTVNDIAAEGARLFAALNVSPSSVRVRSSAGVWSHFQPDGATDLVVGTATRLAWLKSRLMVVGGTNARSIYEVAASSSPVAIETLPEGWAFVDLFEAQGFIHACAVNTAAGLSRVHHYGLNSGLSAIEKKSSTPFPQGQLMYAGCGFPGLAFIGGGIRNSSGGYDPILYRAAVGQELGELQYEEIRQEEGAGAADLSVRAVIPMGETILTSWSLGAGAYGGARDGIAIYHIGRNAAARHLRKTAAGGALRVGGIMPYKGRILLSITGDGLYYEDLATYVTTAQLVTSAADWNNAGLKVWDQIEVSHDALAATHSFAVAYTTESFETATWNTVFTSDVDGAVRADARLSSVKARQFALRITSTGTAAVSPVFLAYNVRSLPSPVSPEFQLTRYIRLLGKDRKDEDAPFIFNDPDDMLAFLQDSIYQFVNFHESNASWIAWLEDVSTVEPEQPFYDLTRGEALKDAFVVRLQMTGTR